MAMNSIEDVTWPSFGQGIRRIGPAFVLGAVTIGPGTITVYTLAGAFFGYSLLWIFVLSGIFAIVYVEMLARFGIISEKTLWGAVRDKYGHWAAVLGGLFAIGTALGFQTGNIVGIGLGMEALVGSDPVIWGTVLAVIAIAFIWLKDLYDRLEKLIFLLILLMIAGFVGTLGITGVSFGQAATGLVPSYPSIDAIFFGLVIMATYFSLYGAIYQAYLVKEKGYTKDDLDIAMFDATTAMVVIGILSMIILATAATVLHPDGIVVDSAAAMAMQLEPLAGANASILFGIGLFAASFSSLIVNALIGGVLLADGLGFSAKFDEIPVKVIATLVTIAGWGLGIAPQLLGFSPIDTIVLAQAFSVIGLPYFGIISIILLNDSEYVGNFKNDKKRNVLAVIGFIFAIAIALNYVRTLVGF